MVWYPCQNARYAGAANALLARDLHLYAMLGENFYDCAPGQNLEAAPVPGQRHAERLVAGCRGLGCVGKVLAMDGLDRPCALRRGNHRIEKARRPASVKMGAGWTP